MLLAVCIASAQNARDSRGRDFWLAVPPNDNSNSTTADPPFFALLIATEDAQTTVTVLARRRSGVVDTIIEVIPPSSMWEIRLSNIDRYQLLGVEMANGTSPDGERPNPASLHLTASHDVSIYAVLRASRSSDAWLVLPTDALSNNYLVMSYPSLFRMFQGAVNVFPSQFVVVSTEDSTVVDVVLRPDRSDRSLGRNRSVVLSRGQSYLLQAKVDGVRQDDLTGTSIKSNKPIAVLGGHRRAIAPITLNKSSRDCLVEQIPGVETWGQQIIVPALVPPSDILRSDPSDVPICRVLSANDSTLVTVNSQQPYLLNKGVFWDLPLDKALVLSATKPILAAIIDRSANVDQSSTRTGDPSMLIVPPVEQYMNTYIVGCVGPNASGRPIYRSHYITVIVPTSAAASLRLDGVTNFSVFRSIIGTDYSYASAEVSSGAHRLESDSAFGVFIYGYGPAESYGYTGGMAFERLYNPVIRLKALDAFGTAGRRDTIAVIIDSIDTRNTSFLDGLSSVEFHLRFDATSFVTKQAGELDSTGSFYLMNVSASLQSVRHGDTLALIVGNHTLGIADSSAIEVDSAVWYSADRRPLSIVTKYVPGELRTLDVCETENRQRLFDPRRATPALMRPGFYDIRGAYVGESLDGLAPGVYFRR